MIVTLVTLITSVAMGMLYLKEITERVFGERFLPLMMSKATRGLRLDETRHRVVRLSQA